MQTMSVSVVSVNMEKKLMSLIVKRNVFDKIYI